MLEQYLLIALIIIVFWIVGYGLYLISSNRQRDLEGDLNHLSDLLDEDGTE